jgi:hypothetical protein
VRTAQGEWTSAAPTGIDAGGVAIDGHQVGSGSQMKTPSAYCFVNLPQEL